MNPIFVPDEVVTAAKMNQLPKGVLGYAEVTANQTGIGATTTDLTGLTVTVNLVANRRIRVTGYYRIIQRTATGTATSMVREGTTELNQAAFTGAVNEQAQIVLQAVLAPTAGSHTYKLSINTTGGTVETAVAANRPGFILVEDIGAST